MVKLVYDFNTYLIHFFFNVHLQSISRNDVLRSNLGYYGESEIRGANDFSLSPNIGSVRSETRMFQPNISPIFTTTNGQSLIGTGQSYGDILERVRYTMHATGSISDALGRPLAGSVGLSSGGFVGGTGASQRQSEPAITGSFNQAMGTSLGSRNVSGNSLIGNTRFEMSTESGNFTSEEMKSIPLSTGEKQPESTPQLT